MYCKSGTLSCLVDSGGHVFPALPFHPGLQELVFKSLIHTLQPSSSLLVEGSVSDPDGTGKGSQEDSLPLEYTGSLVSGLWTGEPEEGGLRGKREWSKGLTGKESQRLSNSAFQEVLRESNTY